MLRQKNGNFMGKKKKQTLEEQMREAMAIHDKRTYKEDFENMKCGNPNCSQIHDCIPIIGRCHPDAPVRVAYLREYGALSIICAECRHPIVLVAVGIRGISLSA